MYSLIAANATLWMGVLPDFGAAIDDALYQGMILLATLLWAPHAIMFSLARYLMSAAHYLATGILPAMIGIIKEVINSTGLAPFVVALAVALVGIGYLIEPFLPEFRLARLGRVLMFGLLLAVVLAAGPQIAGGLETARMGFAREVSNLAYRSLMSDPAFGKIAGEVRSADDAPVVAFDLHGDGMSAYDVAAAAIPAGIHPLHGAVPGQELSFALPDSFRWVYMPYDAIGEGMNVSQRGEAKSKAWKGVARMAVTLPISVVNLMDAVAIVLLNLAAGFVLMTIPLTLLFAVFLPLENMSSSLIRTYLNLFVHSGVLAVLAAVGVAAQLAALRTGALAPVVGASALAFLMELFAIKTGTAAISRAFFSFGNALSANLGLTSNPQADVLRTLGGLGTAGAGLGMLAGARPGSATGGLMALGGGTLLSHSPLRAPATAMATASQFDAHGGRGGLVANARGTLANATAGEAAMAGLSLGGGSPWALFYALNRMGQAQRGSQSRGPGSPEASARTQRIADGRDRAPTAAEQVADGWVGAAASATADDQALIGTSVVPQTGREAMGEQPPGRVTNSSGRRSRHRSPSPASVGEKRRPQDPPGLTSPWRPAIAAARGRYGAEWVAAVTHTVRDLVEEAHERGLNPTEMAASFAGSDGRPDLDSPSGKALLSRLPAQVGDTLSDPQAVVGVQAIIGETMAPRIIRDTQDIAQAIANAVSGEDKNQARNVAKALGVHPQDLGGYFGPIGGFVALAQKHGLDSPTVRQLARETAGAKEAKPGTAASLQQAGMPLQDAERLIRKAQLLPDRLERVSGRLPEPARRE